jgi:hypothetical protein
MRYTISRLRTADRDLVASIGELGAFYVLRGALADEVALLQPFSERRDRDEDSAHDAALTNCGRRGLLYPPRT